MAETNRPSAADLLAVRSRVSWGAIAAGAMVPLTIYVVLTMLGVALGIEMALRGSGGNIGAGAAIYSILVLLAHRETESSTCQSHLHLPSSPRKAE
jgi:hypothetical protein